MSARRVTTLVNNILSPRRSPRGRGRAACHRTRTSLRNRLPTRARAGAAQRRVIEESAGRDFDARRESLLRRRARPTFSTGPVRGRGGQAFGDPHLGGRSWHRSGVALAAATRAKLVAWADFAALAKELSADKASAAEGGSLPWRRRPHGSGDGQGGVRADAGGRDQRAVRVGSDYVLLRLDDRRPASQIPFDEAKDSIWPRCASNSSTPAGCAVRSHSQRSHTEGQPARSRRAGHARRSFGLQSTVPARKPQAAPAAQ